MFKRVESVEDVRPFVADKKEIRFSAQPNGTTIGCYMFQDSKTFDSPEALECRGIAFGSDGKIVSRPLHKFFNMGEKSWLSPQALAERRDVAEIFEKLDGSMIATAWIDGKLALRSKKSFESDVVVLARKLLSEERFAGTARFAERAAAAGMTAIFELTHPEARIVVDPKVPNLRLLHVRDNLSGEYLLLDEGHELHGWIEEHGVERAPRMGIGFADAVAALESMREMEGYVVQFTNGDMAKIKCPWYQRLHRSVTFLRERDIALLALAEELDDVKGALGEAGIDLGPVEEVESRLKGKMTALAEEVEALAAAGAGMDRKGFALANSGHPLFGLAMAAFIGKDPDLALWYERNRLKEDFGLRVLAGEALAEALEG